MAKHLEAAVRRRAGERCEYCHLPQAAWPVPFEIDHVIARQHGGATSLDNLALACGFCNRSKGPNIAGLDPLTKQLTPLFNPRWDTWAEHFRWSGEELAGRTATGRTTVFVLAINQPAQLALRRALFDEDAWGDDFGLG